ncbi:AbrB family transcriptional regulator [Oceanospirillum sanctuarii]|uniref:AbrB family transcriptional regulator n=1 Tax=Oceanospirillum sanctuarii TaxID=1434821 RepID=UPI001FE7FC68|nr:AbrB family transcriptional regulator [Oceanospirillum sanctuarii]
MISIFTTFFTSSFTIAVLAGWIFSYLGIPLGWLIGSLLAVVVTQAIGIKPLACKPYLPYVRGAVGTLLGVTVTFEFIQLVIDSWASIVFLLAAMALTILSGYYTLSRVFNVDRTTSLLCSIPGGMTEISMLSERPGCDQVQVATTHLFRVGLAVLAMPLIVASLYNIEISKAPEDAGFGTMSFIDWLFFGFCVMSGAFFEKRFKLQASVILIPFCITALLHLSGITEFEVPTYIVNIAQLLIGINLGSKFGTLTRSAIKRVSFTSLVIVVIQIGIAVGLGLLAAIALDRDPITFIISYSPGGLAEMSIIAVAMHLEAAFVALNHLFRLTAALLITPVLLSIVSSDSSTNQR